MGLERWARGTHECVAVPGWRCSTRARDTGAHVLNMADGGWRMAGAGAGTSCDVASVVPEGVDTFFFGFNCGNPPQ